MAGALLPPLRDLRSELAALAPPQAAPAQRGPPAAPLLPVLPVLLVLLVSRQDCPYCLEVRRNYLAPLLRGADPRLLVRELESDTVAELVDAAGQRQSIAVVLRQLGVSFFPTVLFLGGGGRTLAEPLRGLDQAGFYGAYLERRLQQALDGAIPIPGKERAGASFPHQALCCDLPPPHKVHT
ncbi:hypothetical protein HSX11_11230 [Oxalobacteraceae bacterium]|nr:hypothetical protein [Oxalobacteraceae bacterium]